MAFKVHRVNKVKAPATLPVSSNSTQQRANSDQDNPSRPGSSIRKPKVPGKPHADLNQNKSEVDSNHNQKKQSSTVYTYAGVEFRPLQITDEGCFSTAIVEGSKPGTSKTEVAKSELQPYEEVTIPSGKFDRVNPESVLVKLQDTSGGNTAREALTADMEQSPNSTPSDLYSEVDNSSCQTRKKPPPIPRPYAKPKDTVDAPDGGKKKPPPLPKPYSTRKESQEEPSQTPDEPVVDAVYAVVNKPLKQQILVDLPKPKKEEEEEAPPLPSRPDFEAEEDDRNSQEDLTKEEPQQEKSGKGSSIIQTIKKHIRQKSDGGQAKKQTDESKDSEVKKSASIEALDQKQGKASKPAVRAYAVTDIVSQPSTKMFGEPETYDSGADTREEENASNGSTDLPDGWQEVKDSGGTYYWHVASGTTQWEKPKKLESATATEGPSPVVDQSKPAKVKAELITVTSFPVHSMGWVELEESQVAPHNMSDTIAECISNLARERKDLWKIAETWGGGKDLRLLLETDNLKLVDCQNHSVLLVQPISKMRVWGAGRDEHKDFAYVARDQATSKHRCHVFRCHGNISGRAIHNKLHEMCNKILAEKKKARENQNGSTRHWSDIMNTPPKPSAKGRKWFS